MAVTRAGMTATVVALLLAGAGAITAAAIATSAATRRGEIAERVARVQGREWCLGTATLASGVRITVGAWEIVRADDGSRSARGPRGTYLIAADGREQWVAVGARR